MAIMIQAADEIIAAIEAGAASSPSAFVVALDGGSGAGKSTIAAYVHRRIDAALIQLDDFYTTSIPEADWPRYNFEQRLHEIFEWERVRSQALIPLRAGKPGRWRAFDFLSGLGPNGTYGLQASFTEVAPAPVILLEGAYSAAPPLADLIDLTILIDVPVHERHRRTAARDDAAFLERWHTLWDEFEAYYFGCVRPRSSCDLVVAYEI
jgi:uridine kinase